jgi:hypothetical protein
LGDQPLGAELKLPAGPHEVKFKAWMRSIVPIDHLEIICNGEVARELKLGEKHDIADAEGTLPVTNSGWCLLRAWSENAKYPILDLYPYATTSPIYISVEGSKPKAKEDAAYFIAWIDQLIAGAQSNTDWNTDSEKATVLEQMAKARKVYEKLLE